MHRKRWENEIHLKFVESLEPSQVAALWRLLLVATFADDDLTLEERRELADAMATVPSFDAQLDLQSRDVTAELDALHAEFERSPEELLSSIAAALGDDSSRRHAFRTVVQLIQSDGFVDAEEVFVRDLGALLGLEPEVVDFAVMDARNT